MCVINILYLVFYKYLYICIKKLKLDLFIFRGVEIVIVKILFN